VKETSDSAGIIKRHRFSISKKAFPNRSIIAIIIGVSIEDKMLDSDFVGDVLRIATPGTN
jgi:hypothetical protein